MNYLKDNSKKPRRIAKEKETLKAGARTYFFDLFETKQGKDFLVITESRYRGEDTERVRNSITLFPEKAAEFGQAVSRFISKLGSGEVSAETDEPASVGETNEGAGE